MPFKTTRDVHFDKKLYQAGKPIPLPDERAAVRDELLALGAIEATGADAKKIADQGGGADG